MTIIADETRATNGHAKGRAAPTEFTSRLPSITLSSGYTVYLRRQPADTMTKAKAAAEQELAGSKPRVPMQTVETGPNETREIENEANAEYQAALAAWQQQVGQKASEKLFTIMLRLALVFEVDDQALSDIRAVYAEQGMDLPEDDRTAYLNYVLAPLTEDQSRLFEEVYGRALPTEAQVALHQAMFPGDMARHADRAPDASQGAV